MSKIKKSTKKREPLPPLRYYKAPHPEFLGNTEKSNYVCPTCACTCLKRGKNTFK